MTIMFDGSHRGWNQGSAHVGICLNDKFEVLKDIGDGSFGSVSLARVRNAGAHVARRGTMVAIKTMKKTFDSFAPCLELREVIFLRTLPNHAHLVPALDIFLDPLSKKLHIAMEYMDGNLYQLMKAREHKPFDGSVVKSILFQILSGLEHIHSHDFFHRDIKPENILVSVSAREDFGSAFKRYSQLVTPPSTPPSYSIKIADFGLARETHSQTPYTTYVSTRWYRAPEVLLRAGEYSAPVDIWAIGAMAVEIATLKPLFPGGNEVDQVWRVCEIMGSPGHWVDKQGHKVGGGQWKVGVKLAQKLGFSFPKMAPHNIDTLLQAPQWPPALCDFITWCLMWDPNNRPTSTDALNHEYFADAVDPLQPKPAGPRCLNRKHSDFNMSLANQAIDSTATLTSKTSSWFRKSLIARESAPAVSQLLPTVSASRPLSPDPSPDNGHARRPSPPAKTRPHATKRNTWTLGSLTHGAPMPILPSIRPISPLSNTITAQAYAENDHYHNDVTKKSGHQFSMISQVNHQMSENHRQEAERALSGDMGMAQPTSGQKEGFFSHLRKRARRISGRHQFPSTPRGDDFEANVGCGPWGVGRNSTYTDHLTSGIDSTHDHDFSELDRVMHNLDSVTRTPLPLQQANKSANRLSGNQILKRHHSVPLTQEYSTSRGTQPQHSTLSMPIIHQAPPGRNRRPVQNSTITTDQYSPPDEQEEFLDEALAAAHAAVAQLDQQHERSPQLYQDSFNLPDRPPLGQSASESLLQLSYPTPSTSEKRHTIGFGQTNYESQSIDISFSKRRSDGGYPFPTPPYEENEWAAAAAAAIFGAGDQWR